MARKTYRYSLNRKDAKLVGVCSTLGERLGIDPTFLRIGFVAAVFLISWEVALVTYVGLAIYFSIQRKRAVDGGERKSEFDRMDRRLMAIESELSKPNDELAREIEALREEK
jgi:phage shock protein C